MIKKINDIRREKKGNESSKYRVTSLNDIQISRSEEGKIKVLAATAKTFSRYAQCSAFHISSFKLFKS